MNTFIVGLVTGASLVCGQQAYGQQASIAGPSSGFVFDSPARVLRPIRGIPGAALTGDPIEFGFDIASASVSPGQDSALVMSTTGSVHLFRLGNGAPAERIVDGLVAPLHVVFSASGTAAALYSPGHVQVIQGLPDAPKLTATLGMGPDRAERLSAEALSQTRGGGSRAQLPNAARRLTDLPLAISDDGAYLLAVSDGAIRFIGTAGDNRKLMDAAPGALAAFAPGTGSGGLAAAILDANAGLVLFQDLVGASVQRIVAGPDSRMDSPVGVAFSADGSKLFVASAAAHAVTAFDISSGDGAVIACDCTPAVLAPMGSLFRLNEMGGGPIWLLDARASEPRMVFVPGR